MIVEIEYMYKDPVYRCPYPEVSKEVFVPDDWTGAQICEWYEKRHSNIHGKGIEVLAIRPMSIDI